MGVLFHPDVPFEFIAAVFAVMASSTRHTFQALTKRPERMLAFFRWLEDRSCGANERYLNSKWYQEGVRARQAIRDKGEWPLEEPSPPTEIVRALYDIGAPIVNAPFERFAKLLECHWQKWPLRNVWLGVTAENQATADERIPLLLQTPAAKRFVSIEPMLGPIDLADLAFWVDESGKVGATDGRDSDEFPDIHWVVVGCESGPNHREMNLDWARSIRDQCKEACVPFFMKQLVVNGKVEKNMELFPEDLRVREYPA
jgi:protein gp37